MARVTQLQWRRSTAASWTSANPVLASGEPGYETDTGKLKIGDGTTAWASLPYFGGSVNSSGAPINVQTFTASGTWTKPSSGTRVLARLWGAGGGGKNGTGIAGGNGGGYVESWFDFSALGATVPVTVGAGGTGGTTPTAGGDSSFSTATANGGGAGGTEAPGGGSGGTVFFGDPATFNSGVRNLGGRGGGYGGLGGLGTGLHGAVPGGGGYGANGGSSNGGAGMVVIYTY